jgi:hypothetical protein
MHEVVVLRDRVSGQVEERTRPLHPVRQGSNERVSDGSDGWKPPGQRTNIEQFRAQGQVRMIQQPAKAGYNV